MPQAITFFNQENLQKSKSLTSSSWRNSSVPEWALAKADRVFAELSVIYGYKWKALHSTMEMWELARHRWAAKLIDLTPEEIDRALQHCCDEKNEESYPPDMREFVRLALGPKRSDPEEFKKLAVFFKPANPEVVRNAIAECHKVLGMRQKPK